MRQYPYGTSGICPNTAHWIIEGQAAIDALHAQTPNYPNNISTGNANTPCTLSLNECFYSSRDSQGRRYNHLKDFEGYDESNPISLAEFNHLLTGVAADLYLHDVDSPGFRGGRHVYDTPFYNGGGRGAYDPEGHWRHDQRACIETIGCYTRSEINYFAQGMWSAAAGESLTTAKAIAGGWKGLSYGERPSEGVYFWIEYGYNYYRQYAAQWNERRYEYQPY